MTRAIRFFIPIIIFLIFSAAASAQTPRNSLRTKYTVIFYNEEKDLNDFLWHIGGVRNENPVDSRVASNRVDRIVERVETILDMHPKNFKANIYIHKEALEPNKVAFYDNKSRSIHISSDYASDGVFAHEIAHAVINQYFPARTPMKIQEILTQYVDKYLWSDY